MPKKNKNKKKNKYSSDSLTKVQSIFILAGGGILFYVVGSLINFGISFALFKYMQIPVIRGKNQSAINC